MVQFADINLIASELAICLFTGRYERIGSNMRWLPKRFSIIVSGNSIHSFLATTVLFSTQDYRLFYSDCLG